MEGGSRRRMSIATAASEGGNPNLKLYEYEENQLLLNWALLRKVQVTAARPVIKQIEGEEMEVRDEENVPNVEGDVKIEEEVNSLTALSQLHPLIDAPINTEQFFINKVGKEFSEIFELDVSHMYGLMDNTGDRIYYIAETRQGYSEAFSFHRPIDFSILRLTGGVFFEIIGSTRKAVVMEDGEIIGMVKKVGCCGMNYIVRNVEHVLFKVSPIADSFMEFDICQTGFAEPIGKIKQKWLNLSDPRLQTMYGMTVPPNLNQSSKLLLISTFIILYFCFFQSADRGQNRKRFWQAFCFSAFVAFLIFVMLVIVVVLVLMNQGIPANTTGNTFKPSNVMG